MSSDLHYGYVIYCDVPPRFSVPSKCRPMFHVAAAESAAADDLIVAADQISC